MDHCRDLQKPLTFGLVGLGYSHLEMSVAEFTVFVGGQYGNCCRLNNFRRFGPRRVGCYCVFGGDIQVSSFKNYSL